MGAALLAVFEDSVSDAAEVILRDRLSVRTHVAAACAGDVLGGQNTVVQNAGFQEHGALVQIGLIGGHRIVACDKIVPAVILRAVPGFGAVGQDVGEGLALGDVQSAGLQSTAVFTYLPDFCRRDAVGTLNRGSQKLQPSVVIQIRHRVKPGSVVLTLPAGIEVFENQIDLCQGGVFRCPAWNGETRSAERCQKDKHQGERTEFFHKRLLEYIIYIFIMSKDAGEVKGGFQNENIRMG